MNNTTINGVNAVKLNPKVLKNILDTSAASVFLVFRYDRYCPYMRKQSREIISNYYGRRDVCLVPLVHDYLMEFKSQFKVDSNKKIDLYYTDKKYFRKAFNSYKDYNKFVIGYFKNNSTNPNTLGTIEFPNYSFRYNGNNNNVEKNVVLFNDGAFELDSLLKNSINLDFKFN